MPGEPILYGAQADGIVPTLLHPNEILDGALTSQLPALNVQTYHIQNHAMVRELYRRHGKQLWFSGVIVMTAPNNVPDIERASCLAAGLAKHQLGVDAVVLTKISAARLNSPWRASPRLALVAPATPDQEDDSQRWGEHQSGDFGPQPSDIPL
jgi:hypothetical protein